MQELVKMMQRDNNPIEFWMNNPNKGKRAQVTGIDGSNVT